MLLLILKSNASRNLEKISLFRDKAPVKTIQNDKHLIENIIYVSHFYVPNFLSMTINLYHEFYISKTVFLFLQLFTYWIVSNPAFSSSILFQTYHHGTQI